METGSEGMEVLAEAECLRLLASTEVGRVGVVADGRPLIFPVNYILDGQSVATHTNSGAKLSGASFAHVAFEIDDFDSTTQNGQSFLVQRIGRDITGSVDRTSEHRQTVPVASWAPVPKPRLLRIEAKTISGRRFLS